MELSNLDAKKLACFICEYLKKSEIDAILVGGACVSIYTHNKYESKDLDFVSYEGLKKIEGVLAEIGFKRIGKGRQFAHKNCPFLIDFVNPPVAIGAESIRNFETLKTKKGSLQLLTPTDCVKDRLASFFHWNDEQTFEQALLVAKEYPVDMKDIERWSKAEGYEEKFKIFKKVVRRNRK